VIRDAIRIERELNREEDLELLYFGGVRSGTDAAKLIGLGATAAVVGLSLALAMGGQIDGGEVRFYGGASLADRADGAQLFLNALKAEASIMPRCTGKTDIHNLEPEDLRSISTVTAHAVGIPLAGFNVRLSEAANPAAGPQSRP
jgi:isopentenyl diphosphate isomerase/L-lactate dehydrogenase-like FMN-dependent dehydrogenase